jgi:hypothetical protein
LELARPQYNAREKALSRLSEFRDQIQRDRILKPAEREDLLQFLKMQVNTWAMLGGGDMGSRRVARAKERIMLHVWQKFTEGMNLRKLTSRADYVKRLKSKNTEGAGEKIPKGEALEEKTVEAAEDGLQISAGVESGEALTDKSSETKVEVGKAEEDKGEGEVEKVPAN